MTNPKQQSFARLFVAVIVGLLGALFIWIATPYNNFVLFNSFISDDYLPVGAVFVILMLVLIVNPLLRRLRPRWALDYRQMAVIFGIVLVASVTPSQGLLRSLPYALANAPNKAKTDTRLAKAYEKLDAPAALFPDEIGVGKETPASTQFIQELNPGESIPWGSWGAPLLSWGAFLIPWWMMMVALALIVYPQWRRNERLPFPLLTVQEALIETPGKGHFFAPIFRNRGFLIAFAVVFMLHLLYGCNKYRPDLIPAIPLSWNLSRFFTEEPLIHMPFFMRDFRIHFMFLGIAFFMPNRVGFSIWFVQLAYAAYWVIDSAYSPPFYQGTVRDHDTGAFFGVALGILWLGRARWIAVFRTLFRLGGTEEERRDRIAGFAFLIGCAGMFTWLVTVGVHPLWAMGFVFAAFVFSLVITRIVAETGLPLIAPETTYGMNLLRLFPVSWHNAASGFYGGMMAFFIGHGNRLCVATFAIHAIGLDRDATPRRQTRLAGGLLAVIVLSLVVCGAVHLMASYHNSATLDGRDSPISAWGVGSWNWNAVMLMYEVNDGRINQPVYNRPFHVGFGAAMAGLMQWLCLMSPRWPIHPVALLFAGGWYAHRVWFNVFLGWLAKVLMLRYGGARLYTSARPFFIGLIMGEVAAVAFWVIVSGARGMAGLPYEIVDILPF